MGTILVVWAVTGVISFFGALAYAELGAMLPHSGGQYVYLREAYGRLPAFLCGWVFFLVIQSGSIATVAVGCGIYLSYLFPSVAGLARWGPVALIVTLTMINYVGVKAGARVQVTFTALKLGGLGLLVASALGSGAPAAWGGAAAGAEHWTAQQLGAAMLACFVAYDGWHVIAFIAGEVRDPKRNLPLALGLGVSAVVAVYVLANVAYFRALPLAEIAATDRVATATAERTLGPMGATIVTLTIVLSTIGAANGSILTAPRIYFAQARDGLFFRKLAEIHPRFETPAFSILTQGAWASLLALSGSYETLFSYVLFASWLIHALAALAVVVLRRKRPELERPYRMWGYPAAPLAFVAFALWFVGTTLAARPVSSLIGCLLIASGVPAYYLWRKTGESSV